MAQNSSTFTSSGTWSKPTDVGWVQIVLAAGGQGGGNETGTNTYGNAGGNGGGVISQLIPVSGNLSVTIGGGGSGVASGTTTDPGIPNRGGVSSVTDTASNEVTEAGVIGKPANEVSFGNQMVALGGILGSDPGAQPGLLGQAGSKSGTSNAGFASTGGAGGYDKGGAGSTATNTKAGNGGIGAGGGLSQNDGGGGDGGDGICIIMWSE